MTLIICNSAVYKVMLGSVVLKKAEPVFSMNGFILKKLTVLKYLTLT
jgi:hypothetical protein